MHAAIGLGQALHQQQCRGCIHSAAPIREVKVEGSCVDDLRHRATSVSKVPTIPFGNMTTINTTKAPRTSLDHSVWLTSQMLSALKTIAPTTAPDTVSTPPS